MSALSERQVLAGVARLTADTADIAPPAAGDRPADLRGPAGAMRALRHAGDRALEALRADPGDQAARRRLLDAIDLEHELRRHLRRRQAARRDELRRSMDRLRPIRDPAALVDAACTEAIRAVGARRAWLSRISDGVWSPWKIALAGEDPGLTASWLGIEPIALEEMPVEGRIARRRRPGLIVLPRDAERVHPALRDIATETHVLAPIAPDDTVIGILHLDRSGQDRAVDADDRDLAWAFCEGFGRIFERAVTHRRLDLQRSLVDRATARQAGISSPTVQITEILPREAGTAIATPGRRGAPRGLLTARELEVADLMAGGLSNTQIGERLIVAPATVKSHVRSILRKLGAANRAQAIGLYLSARETSPD